MPLQLISYCLDHIDIKNQSSTRKILNPKTNNDMVTYLNDLLSELSTDKNHREFLLDRPTTELYTALEAFILNPDLSTNAFSASLSKRLLSKEIIADSKYSKLNKKGTHLRKGSFLQFMFKDDKNCINYLGVKVNHHIFFDETDFNKKVGLPDSNKVYKACKVLFNNTNQIETVLVFDSSTETEYWWSDFLELAKKRTDEYNTKTAVDSVIKTLNRRVKNNHPADYTSLRNATIVAFKQSANMVFSDFVQSIFTNYTAIDPAFDAAKITDLVTILNDLPTKEGFDSTFQLAPKAVGLKQVTIKVKSDIDLKYNEDITNITDKIWAEKTQDGKFLIVLNADEEAFKKFILKTRAP